VASAETFPDGGGARPVGGGTVTLRVKNGPSEFVPDQSYNFGKSWHETDETIKDSLEEKTPEVLNQRRNLLEKG